MENKVQRGEMAGPLGFILKYFSKKMKIRKWTHAVSVVKSKLLQTSGRWCKCRCWGRAGGQMFLGGVIPVKGKGGGSRMSQGNPRSVLHTWPWEGRGRKRLRCKSDSAGQVSGAASLPDRSGLRTKIPERRLITVHSKQRFFGGHFT